MKAAHAIAPRNDKRVGVVMISCVSRIPGTAKARAEDSYCSPGDCFIPIIISIYKNTL